MPSTLVIPLSLNSDGTFVTTDDPTTIVRQRILDLLVTSRWERVHRPNHGCDLEGFLFTNVIDHLLAAKAEEMKTEINIQLTYGEVVQILITPIPQRTESAIQVEVLFRVYEGGEIEQVTQSFSGLTEEGLIP